ncbi:MAG TPA: hypothetical protein VG455_10950 [Acidimicrobiales bacterium]|nr:hypothetical protein [Acidimicrobiales bacterium]
MPEPRRDELPPLGEPTPALVRRRPGVWYRSGAFAAAVALVVGLVLGFAVGRSIDDGSERGAPAARSPVTPSTSPSTTTVVVPALPDDCADALRAAEQVLQLLGQGFETLRRFQVERIEEVLADLDRLRRRVTARIAACQEQLRP